MEELANFSDYIWHFISGYPIQNHWQTSKQVPSTSAISHAMLKDLKKCRLTFVGSTIHYAFMQAQAVGMVNDHTITYFRHKEIENLYLRPNSTLGR